METQCIPKQWVEYHLSAGEIFVAVSPTAFPFVDMLFTKTAEKSLKDLGPF